MDQLSAGTSYKPQQATPFRDITQQQQAAIWFEQKVQETARQLAKEEQKKRNHEMYRKFKEKETPEKHAARLAQRRQYYEKLKAKPEAFQRHRDQVRKSAQRRRKQRQFVNENMKFEH